MVYIEYFSFPDVSALAGPKVEQQLRTHGFGYRAKYIQQSAKAIQEKGKYWLSSLRDVGYEDAHKGDFSPHLLISLLPLPSINRHYT